MTETTSTSTSTSLRVEREVAASAHDVFALLADPRRHPEIDGSGTVLATGAPTGASPDGPGTGALTQVGQSFVMDMDATPIGHPEMSSYQTENHVVEFEADRLITWATARVGHEPPGVWWSWSLREVGPGRTLVTHLYDWSRVTDPATLARISFPRIPETDLRDTVARLAAAVERA